MKIKDLIKELEKYNQEADILINIDDSNKDIETLIAWSYQNEYNDKVYFDTDKCKSKCKEISIKFCYI